MAVALVRIRGLVIPSGVGAAALGANRRRTGTDPVVVQPGIAVLRSDPESAASDLATLEMPDRQLTSAESAHLLDELGGMESVLTGARLRRRLLSTPAWGSG